MIKLFYWLACITATLSDDFAIPRRLFGGSANPAYIGSLNDTISTMCGYVKESQASGVVSISNALSIMSSSFSSSWPKMLSSSDENGLNMQKYLLSLLGWLFPAILGALILIIVLIIFLLFLNKSTVVYSMEFQFHEKNLMESSEAIHDDDLLDDDTQEQKKVIPKNSFCDSKNGNMLRTVLIMVFSLATVYFLQASFVTENKVFINSALSHCVATQHINYWFEGIEPDESTSNAVTFAISATEDYSALSTIINGLTGSYSSIEMAKGMKYLVDKKQSSSTYTPYLYKNNQGSSLWSGIRVLSRDFINIFLLHYHLSSKAEGYILPKLNNQISAYTSKYDIANGFNDLATLMEADATSFRLNSSTYTNLSHALFLSDDLSQEKYSLPLFSTASHTSILTSSWYADEVKGLATGLLKLLLNVMKGVQGFENTAIAYGNRIVAVLQWLHNDNSDASKLYEGIQDFTQLVTRLSRMSLYEAGAFAFTKLAQGRYSITTLLLSLYSLAAVIAVVLLISVEVVSRTSIFTFSITPFYYASILFSIGGSLAFVLASLTKVSSVFIVEAPELALRVLAATPEKFIGVFNMTSDEMSLWKTAITNCTDIGNLSGVVSTNQFFGNSNIGDILTNIKTDMSEINSLLNVASWSDVVNNSTITTTLDLLDYQLSQTIDSGYLDLWIQKTDAYEEVNHETSLATFSPDVLYESHNYWNNITMRNNVILKGVSAALERLKTDSNDSDIDAVINPEFITPSSGNRILSSGMNAALIAPAFSPSYRFVDAIAGKMKFNQLDLSSSTLMCNQYMSNDQTATSSRPCKFQDRKAFMVNSLLKSLSGFSDLRTASKELLTQFDNTDVKSFIDAMVKVSQRANSCGVAASILYVDIPFWFSNLAYVLSSSFTNYCCIGALGWGLAIVLFFHWKSKMNSVYVLKPYRDETMLTWEEVQQSTHNMNNEPFGYFAARRCLSELGCPCSKNYKQKQIYSNVRIITEQEEAIVAGESDTMRRLRVVKAIPPSILTDSTSKKQLADLLFDLEAKASQEDKKRLSLYKLKYSTIARKNAVHQSTIWQKRENAELKRQEARRLRNIGAVDSSSSESASESDNG